MRKWASLGAGLLWASLGTAGCGQELALPTRGQAAGSGADAGPSDGVTGASGSPADGPNSKRLPLLDEPVSLGGAGGQDEDRRCVSCAGSNRGGTSTSGGSKGQGGQASGVSGGEGTSAGAGAGGAPSESEPSAVLLLSEYVEGEGWLKALEILALEGGSLESCEVLTFANGASSPKRVALHGHLERGELQVLCSEALTMQEPSLCDETVSLTFNGDDALALSCDGALLDVFGEIGVDPGDSWGAGATLDHTLQRRCSVTAGRGPTEPFEIDSEWIASKVNDFSGLGRRDCDDGDSSDAPE